MKGQSACWSLLTAFAILYGPGLHSRAEAPAPAPSRQALVVVPASLHFKGWEDSQQLILTATLDGQPQDVTGNGDYEVADRRIARVTSLGRVVPQANGQTEITVRQGGQTVRVPVRVELAQQDLAMNFANQVVPILTKLGCNAGECHAKSGGQNGFQLSVLGHNPVADYQALVMEARGRRVFPAAPAQSLLLRKATGQLSHGGGSRLGADSPEFRLIQRWIAAGMPFGKPADPVVTSVSVYPQHRVLSRQGQQQLAAYAHYSDGAVEDITHRAQYQSNNPDVAIPEVDGLVRARSLSGEAAIMVRFHGQVAVFRARVPLGVPTPDFDFAPNTLVDRFTRQKWQQLGIAPAELCTDEQFIRRASVDICGTLPTPAQVKSFLEDRAPGKRERLIDGLVDSPEYSHYFAIQLADVLRVNRGGRQDRIGRAAGTFAFHGWIREALDSDLPYDEFVTAILTATGDENRNPPTVWYRNFLDTDQRTISASRLVDDVSQVFLGVRLECAQCHHHPYEKWSQDDYWGLAAFFGRVGRKTAVIPGAIRPEQTTRETIFTAALSRTINKRTAQPAIPKLLDGDPLAVPRDEDPRRHLAAWMTDARNPYFARAAVNRFMAHFLGRGLVDPPDDMRVTNPPSNPELVDALAQDFVAHRYSIKHLVKTICKSRTYQFSSVPNEFNVHDSQNYARYYARRLSAEVLYDAVCQVTDGPADFNDLPTDRHAPRRAIMLPDGAFASYFLDVFGRPKRISVCACERRSEATLAQALHLLNSEEVRGKLVHAEGRAAKLSRDQRPDPQKVEEAFLWALSRKPSAEQLELALSQIDRAANKKAAYEDILWALINTRDFLFNH